MGVMAVMHNSSYYCAHMETLSTTPCCTARRSQQHDELCFRLAGHTVIAAHRSDTADKAMPPWSPVEASVDVVCRLHQRINDVYDVNQIDVVVVGIFHQVRGQLPSPLMAANTCL